MIYVKLKISAPYDNIRNNGTMYLTIDGKRSIVNQNGTRPFAIKKGRFVPIFGPGNIPYEWKGSEEKDKDGNVVRVILGLEEAKKRFDPEVFEFFKTQQEALEAVKKEEKLLKMLPFQKMEAKNARAREKVLNSRFGQNRPTMDDVVKEAKKVGVELPHL
jgi:hypothetical protein